MYQNRIGSALSPRHEQHDLGLSPREEARLRHDYDTSLRAMLAGTKQPKNFFSEIGGEARQRARIGDPDGDNVLTIPTNARMWSIARRDASVAGTGGYLVQTENVSFVELLRNRSVCLSLGATKLTGLVGSVTIPKQTAGATAYWLSSETTQTTEGNQTFGQLTLSPKTVGAYTEVSRLLRLQSAPDIGQIVAEDLAKQVAIAADLAALNGAGSGGEPAGLIGQAGGTFSGSTLGLAGLLNGQTDLAAANALGGSLGYVTTPAVAALLMGRVEFTGGDQPLWKGNAMDGTLAGLRAASSAQVPTDTMVLGDWSQLVIGEWGVLEIAVSNSASAGHFQSGISSVRAMYTMDVGVRVEDAFSVATSIT